MLVSGKFKNVGRDRCAPTASVRRDVSRAWLPIMSSSRSLSSVETPVIYVPCFDISLRVPHLA